MSDEMPKEFNKFLDDFQRMSNSTVQLNLKVTTIEGIQVLKFVQEMRSKSYAC